MRQLWAPLFFATSAALLLTLVPSEASYPVSYGWRNVSRNNSYGAPPRSSYGQPIHHGAAWPRSNYSYGAPSRNTSYWAPPRNTSAYRYPRSTAKNTSHNYFWGNKSVYDRLLYFSRVKKESSFMRKVTLDMDFPAKHQRANGTIYYIQILDQEPAGEGGTASILRGGIGYRNVSIHFKSQRNKGFDFTVSVYGR